jgi:hypothetical protein
MNFVISSQKGVNYSGFSHNVHTSHDYINPPVNLTHITNFYPAIYSYQHNQNNFSIIIPENRFKYSIRFMCINNSAIEWLYDDFKERENELDRLIKFCSNLYKA